MASINKSLVLVGYGKQTAKGTPIAAPTFGHGVTGGKIAKVDLDQKPDEITSAYRAPAVVLRQGVATGSDFSTRAFVKSLGLLLLGAFGSVSVTGTGPYVHVFSLGDDLPYLTIFGKYDGQLVSVQDAKIDELALAWEGAKPLEVNATALGTILGFPVSFTPGTDDSRGEFFVPGGGTFKLDVDGSTLAVARITGGSVKVANNLEVITPSASIVPDDIEPGQQTSASTLKLIPADFAEWRTIVTGTAAGSAISEVPVIGSFELTFVNGANTLKLAGARVPFLCDFPEADPKGGPVELELKGEPILPTSGTISPIVATLTNDVATY